MIKWFVISSFVILWLNGRAQVDSLLYLKYLGKGDSIFKILRDNPKIKNVKFDDAVNAYNSALLIFPAKADNARDRIKAVFEHIESERLKADSLRILAEQRERDIIIKNKEIVIEKEKAFTAKRKADSAKARIYQFNLENAPYKYLRLIRDGPKDKAKIELDSFPLKLIAYCNHLDTLELILKSMPTGETNFAQLRENLYYNNELYEKVFYCLDSRDYLDSVIRPIGAGERAKEKIRVRYLGDQSAGFWLSGDGGIIKKNHTNLDTLKPGNQKFTSFALSEKMKMLFGATDDNYILVYGLGDSGELRPMDTIALGTRVTAIDFDDKDSTLYFGTINGEIGFIEYNSFKKRYQPVYSTEMFIPGSEVTAIDFFSFEDNGYLLVTGRTGKAAVYKLDKKSSVPGNNFSGNFLPDYLLGSMDFAVFDASEKQVVLETTNKSNEKLFYWWDPFTQSVLQKFKMAMKPFSDSVDEKFKKENRPTIWEATNYYKSN